MTTTHELCLGDTPECTSVWDENRSASNHSDKSRGPAWVVRVCAQGVKGKPRRHPAALALVSPRVFFTLPIAQRSWQVLSEETHTSLAWSHCENISISEVAGREQIRLEQGIIAVPLNKVQ